ncbi:MAG: flagellar biosynthetic protein FliR [Candidimonas sp.]|nr:MAG: flagellar biosynthetic protein FliR [Candidimonas sp.]
MITIDLAQWIAWIDAFFYPLIRIASFVSLAPIFGESQVPVRVKIGLSVVLAIVMQAQIPPLATPVAPDSAQGIAMAVTQVLVGTALALATRLIFAAVQIAGSFMGLEMDLSFATLFDPVTGANTDVVSELLNVLALLLFVSLNAHLLLIEGLARTFALIPLDHLWITRDGAGALLAASAIIFTAGLVLALPIIISLLLVNLMLGILNRTAQQLSVFSVGFPVTLLAGIFMVAESLPVIRGVLESLDSRSIEIMSEVARRLAGA